MFWKTKKSTIFERIKKGDKTANINIKNYRDKRENLIVEGKGFICKRCGQIFNNCSMSKTDGVCKRCIKKAIESQKEKEVENGKFIANQLKKHNASMSAEDKERRGDGEQDMIASFLANK